MFDLTESDFSDEGFQKYLSKSKRLSRGSLCTSNSRFCDFSELVTRHLSFSSTCREDGPNLAATPECYAANISLIDRERWGGGAVEGDRTIRSYLLRELQRNLQTFRKLMKDETSR